MNSVKGISLLSITSIALLSIILITSQSPEAFAGYCIDDDNDGYYAQDCGGEIDCNDNDPNKYPGHGCDIVEDIEKLIDKVEQLLESGDLDLNNGQTNSILGKLQKAVDNVEDKPKLATNSLNVFIKKIDSFIDTGSISSEDGQTLIDGAQNILDSL